MALRRHLMNDPNEVLQIIDEMSDGSELSGEDDNDSDSNFNETCDQEISHEEMDPEEDDLDDSINTSSNSEHDSDENECLGENHSHSHPSLCPKSPTNKRQVKVKVKDGSQDLTSLLFMRSR